MPHVSSFNAWKENNIKIVQVKILSRDQVDRWLLGPLALGLLLPMAGLESRVSLPIVDPCE